MRGRRGSVRVYQSQTREKSFGLHALPVDVEHDGYSWSEKGWQHLEPAQEPVCVVRPPVHVLSEHGRNGNPYGESHGMKVRWEEEEKRGRVSVRVSDAAISILVGRRACYLLRLFAYARDSICACPTMKRTSFSSRGWKARILAGSGSGMTNGKEKIVHFSSRSIFLMRERVVCFAWVLFNN